ncbi:hypothetical protein Tco_0261198 [Tanacetum coccineum]
MDCQLGNPCESQVTAAELLTTVRYHLVLSVQVNAAEALVDKKKVIIMETSIRSDLHLEDAGGTDCLPTATIFEELARMGAKTTAWNEFSSTMASAIICLATNQKFNLSKYIFNAMKKQSRRKQTKNTEVPHTSDSTADVPNKEHVPTHSHDPLLSDCLSSRDHNLKLRVKKLEKKAGLRTHKFKRLYKVGVTRKVVSSDDEGLGAQEDASKQGRSKIEAIDRDAEVTLVETQRRDDKNDENLMFDTDVLEEQEKDVAEKEVSTVDPVTTAAEVVTTANVEVNTVKAPTTNMDELTLAQTLIEIKIAKPKAVTSAATTTTTTRPKARGVAKDKGKRIMVEPEVPLKKKNQLALDEEMARNLEAQLQTELIEEERIARQKEEEANIALLES